MRSPKATFDSTSRCGNRASSWNISPIPRRCAGTSSMRAPSSQTSPDSARSSPPITRSSDVLPQPLGPITAKISPSATSSDTPPSASVAP